MRHRLLALGSLLLGAALAAGQAKAPSLIESPEAFKTLVNPSCSHCKDEAKRRKADLKDDDRVLCWIRGKYDGGAIPFRFFLNPYRVISDTYGVFVYDTDAGFARGFAPSLDFTFHGWRNGVMVLKHKDGTLYSALSGVAFAGPKKGARLPPVPTLVTDWGDWLKRYPDTVAYHMFEKYKPVDLPPGGSAGSARSRGPVDKRLPPEQMVFGLAHGKQARAYRIEDVAKAGVLHDRVDGQSCVVLWYAPTRTAAAYLPWATPPGKRGAASRAVTLVADAKSPRAPFRDKETGSRWDVAGRCVEGDLKGWVLTWLDGLPVKWYAWSAEYPHTTVHGK
jgi:hypothetical protein